MTNSDELFRSTAYYYARYRKPYPAELFERIERRFGLDGTGRLLDVGCGTGQLAIPLASRFEEVVAIDASAEMIEEAREQAREAGVNGVDFRVMAGEEISGDQGEFRVALFGSALHWMDIDAVLRKVRALLMPGGGIGVVGMRSFWSGDSEWEEAVLEVVQRWLGEGRRAGSTGNFVQPQRRYEDHVADAGLLDVEAGLLQCEFEMDVEFITGHLYSTSFCSRALLGDGVDGFEEDLRDTLLGIEPSGRFVWRPTADWLFATRG